MLRCAQHDKQDCGIEIVCYSHFVDTTRENARQWDDFPLWCSTNLCRFGGVACHAATSRAIGVMKRPYNHSSTREAMTPSMIDVGARVATEEGGSYDCT